MLEQILGYVEQYSVYIAVALMISEALSLIPSLKSNGILQLVMNVLRKAKEIASKLVKKEE